jgi:hypothetical protein
MTKLIPDSVLRNFPTDYVLVTVDELSFISEVHTCIMISVDFPELSGRKNLFLSAVTVL